MVSGPPYSIMTILHSSSEMGGAFLAPYGQGTSSQRTSIPTIDILVLRFPLMNDNTNATSDNPPVVLITSTVTIMICSNFDYLPTISTYLTFGNPTSPANESMPMMTGITGVSVPVVGASPGPAGPANTASHCDTPASGPSTVTLPCPAAPACPHTCDAATATLLRTIYTCGNGPANNVVSTAAGAGDANAR
jgi:hypothetical protein